MESKLSHSVREGIQNPKPSNSGEFGSLKHTPRYPDLAKIWRSGGSQRNAWMGALGVLAHQECLNEAISQASLKLSTFEAYKMNQAVMDWCTSVYIQVQPPVIQKKVSDEDQSIQTKSMSPYMAEMTLFGIPVLGSRQTIDDLLSDSNFTSLLREYKVFDESSITVFLGSMKAENSLAISSQSLYSLTRAFRSEMLNFWETGDSKISPVAQVLLNNFLNENQEKSDETEDLSEKSVQVLVGIRLALCRKDGRSHDVLSERRTSVDDEKYLDVWHSHALDYIKQKNEDLFLMGDPKSLGKTSLDVLGLLTEGQSLIWASDFKDKKIVNFEVEKPNLDSEEQNFVFTGIIDENKKLPSIKIPWNKVEPHYYAFKKRMASKLVEKNI